MSPDITGAEDLDAYGRWGYDPAYGNVWTPNVPPGWAPYSNGQWVWEDYYGWTWVDYDPWGWAPFHYGSWYFRAGFGWSWFPGPRYGHYWYHPAMVGFFGFGGGVGVGFGFGNVGWIPLAPFEVFRPWYGPGWFGGGAFGGGRFARCQQREYYSSTFRNARVANGVNAVSAQDFQRGAFSNRVAVNGAQLQQASLVRGAVPMTPTANNLRFSESRCCPPRGRGPKSATSVSSAACRRRAAAAADSVCAAAGRGQAGVQRRQGGIGASQAARDGEGSASPPSQGNSGSIRFRPGAALQRRAVAAGTGSAARKAAPQTFAQRRHQAIAALPRPAAAVAAEVVRSSGGHGGGHR